MPTSKTTNNPPRRILTPRTNPTPIVVIPTSTLEIRPVRPCPRPSHNQIRRPAHPRRFGRVHARRFGVHVARDAGCAAHCAGAAEVWSCWDWAVAVAAGIGGEGEGCVGCVAAG